MGLKFLKLSFTTFSKMITIIISEIITKSSTKINICKMNDEMLDKVHQSIVWGSPFEALYSNFVTFQDILEYLTYESIDEHVDESIDEHVDESIDEHIDEHIDELNMKPSVSNLIAYKCVCLVSKKQLVNGKHFLLNAHDDYVCLYYLLHGFPETTDDTDQNLVLMKKFEHVSFKLRDLNNYTIKYLHILANKLSSSITSLNYIEKKLAISARSDYYIINTDHHLFNDYMYILNSTKYEEYESIVLERCLILLDKAPLYWENVGNPMYLKIVKQHIFDNSYLISSKSLEIYNQLFPDLLPEKWLSRSSLVYTLSTYPDVIKAYILGFPIHLYIPSKSVIETALDKLDDQGIDKYCEYLRDHNRKVLFSHIERFDENSIDIGNENDTLLESVLDYNLTDVVKYYIDSHVYFFTRAEFDSILEKGSNHWTSEPFLFGGLENILSRVNISRYYSLPPSEPIKDILIKISDGKLLLKHNECENCSSGNNIDDSVDNTRLHFSNLFNDINNVDYESSQDYMSLNEE